MILINDDRGDTVIAFKGTRIVVGDWSLILMKGWSINYLDDIMAPKLEKDSK